jgi:CheY-like chemotaxis protein
LVVEDDAVVALLYKNLLETEGYEIQPCGDGVTALETLAQEKFDAVILDLMIPQVDGIQVLKGMRASVKNALTPAIIVTAARLQVVQDEAMRYGAKRFLDKTQTDQVVAALREILAEGVALGPGKLRLAPLAPIAPQAPPQKPAALSVPIDPEESPKPKGLARLFRRRNTGPVERQNRHRKSEGSRPQE